MSRVRLAVLLAGLLVVPASLAPSYAFAGKPSFATEQFVRDAIGQFNHDVVQPLAGRVGLLENQVADHEQRLSTLEAANQPPMVITDRALVMPQAGPPWVTHLLDTDDGSVIAQYTDSLPFGASCDGRRGLLNNNYVAATLIDGSSGGIVGAYDAPQEHQLQSSAFSCHTEWALASSFSAVTNRLALVWAPTSGAEWNVTLIDSDTGQTVGSYSMPQQPGGVSFSCLGDALLISRLGLFDSVIGAKLQDAPEESLFLCR